jgi:AcrR family transcriptional regulator
MAQPAGQEAPRGQHLGVPGHLAPLTSGDAVPAGSMEVACPPERQQNRAGGSVASHGKESAGARRYSSPLRAEQARLTRRRILEAARELFLTRGYAGTTLDGVAAQAAVSPQTVYNAIGGKAALLKAVYDTTLAGDDEPIAIGDRPEFQQMLAEPDPRRILAHYAKLGRTIGSRVFALIAMAQAAASDRDVRAFLDTIEAERTIGTRGCASLVAARSPLRPGLTLDEAADILWSLTGPDLADRLIVRRGWTWDRFEPWLAVTMADALLGP